MPIEMCKNMLIPLLCKLGLKLLWLHYIDYIW